MKQTAPLIQSDELRKFAPLDTLGEEDAQELLRTAISIRLSPGTPVFSQDDMDKQVFYLLKGKVELRSTHKRSIIAAGTPAAATPLGRHLPDQVSAKAVEESVLISFDADMLDLFLNWTNPNAYEVNEMETGQDHAWMNRLLQSRGLLRFSETQINTLLERMNEVHVDAGQTVVTQGESDDFYYVIKEGSATVSRQPDASAKPIKLAELHEGDAFGEESLLTAAARGATVTMEQEGTLMRLSKQDFSELLADPLLSTISWEEAQAMAATGGVLVDIRLQDEFKHLSLPGAVNIPLPVLRLKLKSLKQNRKYIIFCDDGSRSSVAAFLLNRHGFDAFVLGGGLSSVIPLLGLKPTEPADSDTDNNAAVESEPVVSAPLTAPQPQQKKRHQSLADYWGATVDEVSDDTFTDSEAVYKIEKSPTTPTRAKPSVVTDIKRPVTKPIATPKAATGRKPMPAPVVSNPYGRSHPLRNILLALAVLGLATYFTGNQFVTEQPVETGPAATATAQHPPTAQRPTLPVTPPPTQPAAPAAATPAVEPQTPDDSAAAAQPGDAMGTYLSAEGEVLQLQPVVDAVEAEADAAPEPTPEAAIDPATRGFRD